MNKNIKELLIQQYDYCSSIATKHSERYREHGIPIDWENYRYWDGRREGIRVTLDLLEGDD